MQASRRASTDSLLVYMSATGVNNHQRTLAKELEAGGKATVMSKDSLIQGMPPNQAVASVNPEANGSALSSSHQQMESYKSFTPGDNNNPCHMIGVSLTPGCSEAPTQDSTRNGASGDESSCAGCGQAIWDRTLLSALDKNWHSHCLKCYCCGGRLADLGPSLFLRSNMLLCRQDYLK